jgi:hypothetical protein
VRVSTIVVEQIDSSNNIVSVIFTSSVFIFMPLFVPWVQPPPIRKYRITYNGNSTSFLGSIVTYWRPEVSIVNIPNYSQPSNKFSSGNIYDFYGGTNEKYFGPPLSFFF